MTLAGAACPDPGCAACRGPPATWRPAGGVVSLGTLGQESSLFLVFDLFLVAEGEETVENQRI